MRWDIRHKRWHVKTISNFLIFLGLLLPAATCHCAERAEITLKQAVEHAIRHNLEVRNEALNTSMADSEAARSRSLYNPMLSATANRGKTFFPGESFGTTSTIGSVGLSQNLPTGGSVSATTQTGYTNADSELTGSPSNVWQSSVAITVSQPILKNSGKRTTELAITLADTNVKDSLERFRGYLSDTVLSVITSYNHLYSLRKILQSKEESLKSARALLGEINKRPKPGPKQKLEVANLEYAISQRTRELVDAERNIKDQEGSFRYLIGMAGRGAIIPTDPPARDEPPETEEEAVKRALVERPDLRQLRSALKASELQAKVARHQMLPDLSVTASAGQMGDAYRQIGEGKGKFWSAGVQFSVPLGNTAAKNDFRKSEIRVEQARNQIKALEWRITNEVEADLRALMSARLQRQTTDQALKYAEQRREEYQKQSKSGEAAVQDAINADNDLNAARNAQLDALETFSLAVAKLWKDSGVLLDHQGVKVDAATPLS
jgi:outer membrane protein